VTEVYGTLGFINSNLKICCRRDGEAGTQFKNTLFMGKNI
jgi:hypothetical protein